MWKRGKSRVSPIIHVNNRRGQKRIRPQGTELAEERAAKEGLQRRRVCRGHTEADRMPQMDPFSGIPPYQLHL